MDAPESGKVSSPNQVGVSPAGGHSSRAQTAAAANSEFWLEESSRRGAVRGAALGRRCGWLASSRSTVGKAGLGCVEHTQGPVACVCDAMVAHFTHRVKQFGFPQSAGRLKTLHQPTPTRLYRTQYRLWTALADPPSPGFGVLLLHRAVELPLCGIAFSLSLSLFLGPRVAVLSVSLALQPCWKEPDFFSRHATLAAIYSGVYTKYIQRRFFVAREKSTHHRLPQKR